MHIRTLISRFLLAATVAALPCLAAGATHAAASSASECATVTVTAHPVLNTAMIPETIKSTVTSCASATETVKLVQHISLPFAGARKAASKTWTITLTPGQSVLKVRHFPYTCCGTYNVTDTVSDNTTGMQLAKATAQFTFA